MGKKMAGTNEFAFFRCRSICTGGGSESGRKKFKKCLPAGTGTKICLSSFRKVPAVLGVRPISERDEKSGNRARKRHINFEHINFLKVGATLGQPAGYNQREKFIFPVFRGEHINFLARLTLGQPVVCARAIWTLTRAKILCLCASFLPEERKICPRRKFWTECPSCGHPVKSFSQPPK